LLVLFQHRFYGSVGRCGVEGRLRPCPSQFSKCCFSAAERREERMKEEKEAAKKKKRKKIIKNDFFPP